MEICPKAQNFPKDYLKFSQTLIYTLGIAQRLTEFCQIGEISPNLVIMIVTRFCFRTSPNEVTHRL